MRNIHIKLEVMRVDNEFNAVSLNCNYEESFRWWRCLVSLYENISQNAQKVFEVKLVKYEVLMF